MTPFFDLPSELRLKIYRRSRFLRAKELLEAALISRSMNMIKLEYPTEIKVAFQLTHTKTLSIIRYFRSHCICVDTDDTSCIHVVLSVQDDNKVILTISNLHMVRHGVQKSNGVSDDVSFTFDQWLVPV